MEAAADALKVGGVAVDDVVVIPTTSLPVRTIRSVILNVYDEMPKTEEITVDEGESAADVVRDAIAKAKGQSTEVKSTKIAWDVHVEVPSNLFKPTESDKEALIKKLNKKGFTVTFLMNSGASTVKLDDLDSQPYTEKLDAFLDVDTSTHKIISDFFGESVMIKLPEDKNMVTFAKRVKEAMLNLPPSTSWFVPDAITDANARSFLEFYFTFADDTIIATKTPIPLKVSINGKTQDMVVYGSKGKGEFSIKNAIYMLCVKALKDAGYTYDEQYRLQDTYLSTARRLKQQLQRTPGKTTKQRRTRWRLTLRAGSSLC